MFQFFNKNVSTSANAPQGWQRISIMSSINGGCQKQRIRTAVDDDIVQSYSWSTAVLYQLGLFFI